MKKYTIEDMQKLAQKREGKCLSAKYYHSHSKLKWQCNRGHVWNATPSSINNGGHWCPYCARNVKLTIEDMQKIAEERGGKCLSLEYINSDTKLLWRCKEGHEWESTPTTVKHRKRWCPYCAGKLKLTIEEMQHIAESRGGICLSKKYINSSTKLKWQCVNGHVWEATPRDIKSGGKWCPYCVSGRDERIVRNIFEKIFSMEFPTKRPSWLINPTTGKRLELDGYCEKLRIAFEYQGQQHYKSFEDHFHKRRSLKKQQRVDELKKLICNKNDVTLVVTPYQIAREEYPNYIINECRKNGINISNIPINIFDYKTFDGIYSPQNLKDMKQIAKERGGECLSDVYVDSETKLRWRCGEGHEWEAIPYSVKNMGHWCPYCSGRIKLTIEEMREIAESREGKCLSDEYMGNKNKLKWQCKEGHVWEATPHSVKRGTWCADCVGIVKLTIEEMQRIANKKGGECLSTEYINARAKLKWRCSEGHEWENTSDHVKNRGQWCPICARKTRSDKRKLSIEMMEEIAEGHGGKCLSNEYVNNLTKLKWECREGHRWEATSKNIKNRGHWCPICARKKISKKG